MFRNLCRRSINACHNFRTFYNPKYRCGLFRDSLCKVLKRTWKYCYKRYLEDPTNQKLCYCSRWSYIRFTISRYGYRMECFIGSCSISFRICCFLHKPIQYVLWSYHSLFTQSGWMWKYLYGRKYCYWQLNRCDNSKAKCRKWIRGYGVCLMSKCSRFNYHLWRLESNLKWKL